MVSSENNKLGQIIADSFYLRNDDCELLSILFQRRFGQGKFFRKIVCKSEFSVRTVFNRQRCQPSKINNHFPHAFEKEQFQHILMVSQRILESPNLFFELDRTIGNSTSSEIPENHELKSLDNLLTLKNDLHLMVLPLQKTVKDIEPTRRLMWIVNLLIDRHHESECRKSLSIAIRLSLQVCKLLNYSDNRYDLEYACHSFVKMIQKNDCEQELLGDVLKVFFKHWYQRESFIRETRDLKHILSVLPEDSWTIKGKLNYCLSGRLRLFDVMFTHKNFVTLVEFGAFSEYSKNEWHAIEAAMHGDCFFLKCPEVHQGNTLEDGFVIIHDHQISTDETPRLPYIAYRCLRVYQVYILFMMVSLYDIFRKNGEYLLNLLWTALPDPFLTREDIEYCVDRCSHQVPVIKKRLRKSFHWYRKIILNGENWEKTPRSLQHLCRFTIRKTLSLSFQLPDGVQSLNLPLLIKNFLLLKNCGICPFQEYSSREKYRWLHSMHEKP